MPQLPRPSPRASVALVTGAGSGIGEALSRRLVGLGWTTVLTDIDFAAVDRIATEIGGSARPLDVRDHSAWIALIEEVEREIGPVGLLANNAGIGVAGPFEELREDDWRRLVDINLMGVVHGMSALYAPMKTRGQGIIINVASGAALCPRPGMVAYAASKAAVVALTTSLRAEALEHGVRVTAACPGYVQTQIMTRTTWRGVDGSAVIAAIPISPMSADECAERILRGALGGRAIVPVGGGIRMEWLLCRLSPRLAGWLASLRWRAFSRHRSS